MTHEEVVKGWVSGEDFSVTQGHHCEDLGAVRTLEGRVRTLFGV